MDKLVIAASLVTATLSFAAAPPVRCERAAVPPVPIAVSCDLLAQVGRGGREARMVPEIRDGQMVGLRLYAVRPAGLYAALGLETGDVLKRVAGAPLNPSSPLSPLRRALDRGDPAATITFERVGREQVHRYQTNGCCRS